MTTNTHIFIINERIHIAKQMVDRMDDSPDKQLVLALLDDVFDHLFGLHSDMRNDKDKIAELQKKVYEPVMSAQLTYPDENDYNGVREYVDSRRERDPIFKQYCGKHTRKELCERLTDEFGWVVDPKCYGVNISRH